MYDCIVVQRLKVVIVTQINPNINYNPYNVYPQQSQAQPVRLPNYYRAAAQNSDKPTIKDMIKENPAYDMLLKPFVEHPIAVLATWLGLGVALDAYSDANRGEYNKTLVKKAANLGDKIQNSKIIQNKPVQTVLNGIGSVGKAGGKVVNNSAILRAMKETPTMPEWSMVKSQMFNQKQEVVQDFIKIVDTLKLDTNQLPQLKDVGLNTAEKEMLKRVFNTQKISQIPEQEAVNQILLNRLGKSPVEIEKIQKMGAVSTKAVKEEILKEMGLTTDKIKLIKDDVYGKYINDVMTATGKVKGKVRMGAGHYGWMGVFTKPFERTIGCDEVYNKLHSMSDGAKTGTGRFMSKAMQMVHRGLTFGNGKLGALIFIAPLLVELGISVGKADKDQKIGTAANGFVDNISWVFTFPLALKMLHSVGGIKLTGMGKDKVEQYRKIVEDFNKRVEPMIEENGIKMANPNTFKNKMEYDIARRKVEAQLKDLKTVKGQNIFTRGLRKIAGILTPDLCRLNSYRNSNPVANTARKIPAFMRNMVGVPARVVLWAGLSMAVLGGALTKITSSIFGKSYDSMKEDERKDEKKKQEEFLRQDLNQRMVDAQRAKVYGNSQQVAMQAKTSANNVVSRGHAQGNIQNPQTVAQEPQELQEEKVDNYTYIPSQNSTIPQPKKQGKVDNYTYIPSSECTIKSDKVNENQRRYIPSQAAANIQKTYDNSGMQSVLDRAQKAEDKALRVLAGNFDGM